MENSKNKKGPERKFSSIEEIIIRWEAKCSDLLVGKTIDSVRYLNKAEQAELGWFKKSLVIFFTDGSYLFPSADDEGNDAGALFTSLQGLEGIPAI